MYSISPFQLEIDFPFGENNPNDVAQSLHGAIETYIDGKLVSSQEWEQANPNHEEKIVIKPYSLRVKNVHMTKKQLLDTKKPFYFPTYNEKIGKNLGEFLEIYLESDVLMWRIFLRISEINVWNDIILTQQISYQDASLSYHALLLMSNVSI